jgi:tetratricopeptide (TPR) repeat protein
MKLPGDAGLAALCRVVRFEISELLSKRAAMRIMSSEMPGSVSARDARIAVIERGLSGCRRKAAEWLASYRQCLTDPAATLDAWQRFIQEEEEVLRLRPSRSQRELVRDFLQWRIRVLDQLGRRGEAIAVIQQSSLLKVSDADELAETLTWLIQRKAWTELDEVARTHQALIESHPLSLYLLARSFRDRQRPEQARELAEKAFQKTPDSDPQKRSLLAAQLVRGLMRDWAEREYLRVMETTDADSEESIKARVNLARVKHHWGEHKPAADLLEPLVKKVKADRNLRGHMYYSDVVGVYHFALGLHYQQTGDIKNARYHLERSFEKDPSNIDALIAMYRLEHDDEIWKDSIKKRIEHQIQSFDVAVRAMEQQYQRFQTPEVLEALAFELNQYAWMVGNTFGDYPLALARSQRSLELKPDYAGYLDTLARCHFALNDIENALAHQRRAAELEPFEGQIVRQLEFFEKTRAEKAKRNDAAANQP